MSAIRKSIALSLLTSAGLALAACSPSSPPATTADTVAPASTVADTTMAPPMAAASVNASPNATEAQVMLKPTQGHTAAGTMTLRTEADGVRISGQLTGLKPGSEHGFHIHENGDCSAPDAASAGGHFNPASQAHGSMQADVHHAGDMPNQRANAQGVADVNLLVHDISLQPGSDNNAIGRALIVHEQPDDYKSQPSGDAGPRIACGVITSDGAAPQG